MPTPIVSPKLQVPVERLTPDAFAAFGSVIENPQRPNVPPTSNPPTAVQANQGSALKYLDVSHMTNFYNVAPSRKPAKAVMNMFVCSPRPLRSKDTTSSQVFDVQILERHPFTSQTFIPMGLSASDPDTRYLVIVAPTLPLTHGEGERRPPPFPLPERPRRSILDVFSRARPTPFTNESRPSKRSDSADSASHNHDRPKGPGFPDLSQVKAFMAAGNQAVTYAAGTWHAPMVVLGKDDVDFVVVQFANGVGLEDCQEVELRVEGGSEGISVDVGMMEQHTAPPQSSIRAKL